MSSRERQRDERPPWPEPLTPEQRAVLAARKRMQREIKAGEIVPLPPEVESALATLRQPV